LVSSDGTVQKYAGGDHRLLASWPLRDVRSAFPLAGDALLVVFANGNVVRLTGTDTNGTIIVSGLHNLTGFALASDAVAYALDAAAGRASRIDLRTGQATLIARDLRNPRGLAVTAQHELLTIEMDARQLVRLDISTGSRQTIATDLPVGGADNPTMAAGIAVGANGTIYLSSDVDNSLWKLTPKRSQ
jgi:sugar lactone lactonase YvrE